MTDDAKGKEFSERTEVRAQLDQAQEIFGLLVDAVRDYAIFALDPHGYVLTWNEGAKRLKGYQASEIIGSHFSRFYTPEDLLRNHPQNELAIAIETGAYQEEGWRLRKDGSRFWASVLITVLKDSTGRLRGFAKVIRDLTERKIAEDQLKRAYEGLERRVCERTAELLKAKEDADRAVRVRDEFLSIASHELKTPLTALTLQVQVRKYRLKQGKMGALGEEQLREMFEDDDRQISRISRLVDDMLDISKISLGKFLLERKPSDLAQIVNDVVRRFSGQLEDAGMAVYVCVGEKISGFWDPYRMEQVLTNLLTNAMKYGAGHPVRISVEDHGDTAWLIVADQGRGISKQDQSRVFQQFERAVSADEVSGLGLGLYIVKQIVQAHGGVVRVESEENKGATFIVELPKNAS